MNTVYSHSMESFSTQVTVYTNTGRRNQRMSTSNLNEIYTGVDEAFAAPSNKSVLVVTGPMKFTAERKADFTERLLEDGETASLINYATHAEITGFSGKKIKLYFVFDGDLVLDFVEIGNDRSEEESVAADEPSTDISGDLIDIAGIGSTQATNGFY